MDIFQFIKSARIHRAGFVKSVVRVCLCSISLNYIPVNEIKWTVQFFLCGMLVCLVYTIDDNCCHLIDCPFYRSSTYCVIMCWLILWTVLKLMPILRIWCDAYTFGINLIPNSTVNCNPYQFSYKLCCYL